MSRESVDRERKITRGAVTLAIRRVWDYDGHDDGYLGVWCNRNGNEPMTNQQKLVHRGTLSVMDHHGIWRDEKGRIVSDPGEGGGDWREFQFTFHDNGHDRIAYAVADHKRMVGLVRGDWGYMGVRVRVLIDGVEVGEASVWGIESESEEGYFLECERQEAREALREARQWLERRGVVRHGKGVA